MEENSGYEGYGCPGEGQPVAGGNGAGGGRKIRFVWLTKRRDISKMFTDI